MSVIVLEGPDGSGKSTLAEQLRSKAGKRYFAMVRHSCRPLTFSDAMRFYDWINSANKNLDVIVDRHVLISEPIYGPVLRNTDLLKQYNTSTILGMLEQSVNVIVYCRPSFNVMEKSLEAQPQLAGVKEKLFTLMNKYDACMKAISKQTKIRVIEYDWTKPDAFPHLFIQLFGDLPS